MKTKPIQVEPPYEISVRSAQNGYILRQLTQLDTGVYRATESLIETDDSDDNSKALQVLFYELADFLGEYKVDITVKPKED